MKYDDEISRLTVIVRDVLGREAHRRAVRRAQLALRATPPDPDGTWPGSALNEFIYRELRKLVH